MCSSGPARVHASATWLSRKACIEPDPLKIKYREALIEAVQLVVKGCRRLIRKG